ncbi:hypothetical protein [Flavobacterium chungangense]|uniref:hypothetical protein n=2 Tax=Flavobacterium chungangense TaxID=554283 RepID=UPI0004DFA2EE|nr:hypothetical protein [Flavobacterium chungangense]
MKKILCLFGALTFALTSCSSDDSSSDSSDSVLLKKTISTDSDGEKVTTIYKYNGNKIVSIVDGDLDLYYTYTGNLITKIEYKYPGGTLAQLETFEYDSENKVISRTMSEPLEELGRKDFFTYSADGTILVSNYIGDHKTQTMYNGKGKLTLVNGEVVKYESDYAGNLTFKYDDKNNPMKNILGYGKITSLDGTGDGTSHNVVSEEGDGPNYTYAYEYNSKGYPTKSIEKADGETEETIELFY